MLSFIKKIPGWVWVTLASCAFIGFFVYQAATLTVYSAADGHAAYGPDSSNVFPVPETADKGLILIDGSLPPTEMHAAINDLLRAAGRT